MPRPVNPQSLRQSGHLARILFSQSAWERINRKAMEAGISASEWIRRLAERKLKQEGAS